MRLLFTAKPSKDMYVCMESLGLADSDANPTHVMIRVNVNIWHANP